MFNFFTFDNPHEYQQFQAFSALLDDYKNFLVDDFAAANPLKHLLNTKLGQIVFIELFGEFFGFFYLYDWKYNAEKFYSVGVSACSVKKFWGRRSFLAGEEFFELLFKTYGFKFVKAEVYAFNKRVLTILKSLGFSFAYSMPSCTLKKASPVDIDVYYLAQRS